MIVVTVGTQKFQFNRLLEEIDNLIEKGIITEPVIVQVGYSTYRSRNYEMISFLENEKLKKMISSCRVLITHAGLGTIIQGLELKKKMIVVPRQKMFGEHVDDHQNEIAEKFETMGYITVCRDMKDMEKCYLEIENFPLRTFQLHYSNMIDFVNEQIEKFAQD